MENLAIIDFIPHRKPFIMVSSIQKIKANEITTTFKIAQENIFCDSGKFKVGGLIENVAQSAAIYAGNLLKQEGKQIPIAFISSIKNIEVFKLPLAGETITTVAKKIDKILDFEIFKGEIFDQEKHKICECELRFYIQN